jgi:hypothetical protein
MRRSSRRRKRARWTASGRPGKGGFEAGSELGGVAGLVERGAGAELFEPVGMLEDLFGEEGGVGEDGEGGLVGRGLALDAFAGFGVELFETGEVAGGDRHGSGRRVMGSPGSRPARFEDFGGGGLRGPQRGRRAGRPDLGVAGAASANGFAEGGEGAAGFAHFGEFDFGFAEAVALAEAEEAAVEAAGGDVFA